MKSFLFTLLLVLSQFVNAYTLVAKSDSGTDMYVDLASIQKFGNTKWAWEKYNFSTVRNLGSDSYQSVRLYQEYDCKEKRSRRLQFTVFAQRDFDGAVLISDSKPTDWGFIAPDSVAFIVMTEVCKR